MSQTYALAASLGAAWPAIVQLRKNKASSSQLTVSEFQTICQYYILFICVISSDRDGGKMN